MEIPPERSEQPMPLHSALNGSPGMLLAGAGVVVALLLAGRSHVSPLAIEGSTSAWNLSDLVTHWHVTGALGAALMVSLSAGISSALLVWAVVLLYPHDRPDAPPDTPHNPPPTARWHVLNVLGPIIGALVSLTTFAWLLTSEHNPLNLEL